LAIHTSVPKLPGGQDWSAGSEKKMNAFQTFDIDTFKRFLWYSKNRYKSIKGRPPVVKGKPLNI
jgi:hypothetical protein